MGIMSASVLERAGNAAQTAQKKTKGLSGAYADLGSQMNGLKATSSKLLGVWGDIIDSSPALKKQVDEINGSFGTMAKSLGKSLIPTARKLASVMKGLAKWFSGLSSNTRWAIGVVFALVTGVVVLSQVVLALATAIGGIATAFSTLSAVGGVLSGAMAALSTSMLPIIAIALALIAVVGILYLAWKNNLFGIRNVVKQAFAAVTSAIKKFVGFVKPFVEKFLSAVFEGRWKDALKTVLNFTKAVLRKVLKTYVTFALAVNSEIAKLGARIVSGFELAWKSAANATKQWINSLVGFFEGGINAILDGLDGLTAEVERSVNDIIRALNELPKFDLDLVSIGSVGNVSLDEPFEARPQAAIERDVKNRLQTRLTDIENGERKLRSMALSEIDGLLGTEGQSGSERPSPPSPTPSTGGGQTNTVNVERMVVNSGAPGPSSRRDSSRLADDISTKFADEVGRR